jgi:RNA polymerase sigma factor (TIGR02999 family)
MMSDDVPPDLPPDDSVPGQQPEVRQIAAELLPLFYQELKRTAHRSRTRMGAGVTLQTTALVHEAYLRLGPKRPFNDPTHFLRASAIAMRHAIISYAKERLAQKRGGGALHLTLSHALEFSIDSDEGLVALEEAMQRLASESPRLSDVVECRFFGGLSEQETAQALRSSLRTVQRDWLRARAWLFRELGNNATESD